MKTFIDHDIPSIERIDGPSGRVYATPNGKKYPSVTAITGLLGKEAIMEWRKRVGEEEANRVSARASKRGTAVHELCEEYIKGNNPTPSLFDQEMFNSLKQELDKIDYIHALETKLYSHHLQIAGTVDCIAEYEGKLSVIDFKTSSRVKHKEDIHGYFLQCSAYAVAFEELTCNPVPNLVIIMGVDGEKNPLVFKEKRDNWIKTFIELREDYSKLKGI